MSELSDKVREAISFLSPEAIEGLLLGTLEALEEAFPGYTDHLVLGTLAIQAGMDPGKPYGEDSDA